MTPPPDASRHRATAPAWRAATRRSAAPLAAAAAAAAVVWAVLSGPAPGPPGTAVGRWVSGGVAASARPAPQQTPQQASPPQADPFGAAASPVAGTPTRLRVPAIKVDTGLERLTIGADGELTPPVDFGRAGWYADGTAPGDLGPAVIAGHVDSKAGPAVFHRLRELTAGDTIEVVRGGRPVRFTVTSTAWYPKNAFPGRLVYGPTPDRQLRLITCGGVFDRSLKSYKDNLVVYAVRN